MKPINKNKSIFKINGINREKKFILLVTKKLWTVDRIFNLKKYTYIKKTINKNDIYQKFVLKDIVCNEYTKYTIRYTKINSILSFVQKKPHPVFTVPQNIPNNKASANIVKFIFNVIL